jgi:hypothetical protein
VQRVRWRIERGSVLCFAPLAPGRGEGLGVRGKSAQWLLFRGRGADCKSLLRLGLRGHHPHPPAPSPASGRGGEASAIGAIHWGSSARVFGSSGAVRWRIARCGLCFAPLAPGRGEGLGVRGKSAQWLLFRGRWVDCKSLLRLGLRGRHPHPPAPSPASGRGGEASAPGGFPKPLTPNP